MRSFVRLLLALLLAAACSDTPADLAGGGSGGGAPVTAPTGTGPSATTSSSTSASTGAVASGPVSLIATPPRIAPGGSSVLTWTTEAPATKIEIVEVGDVTAETQVTVTPATSTLYRLRVTTAAGILTATAAVIVGNEPTDMPVWRQGMALFEWRKISGTNLAQLEPPSLGDVDAEGQPFCGSPNGRTDAWNGLAVDTSKSRIYSAAAGGHCDYAGNEVYELDLAQDAPAWVMLRAPTDGQYVYRGDQSVGKFNDYYLDDRPASTHTYNALHFLPSQNALFKFGAGSTYGTGGEGNSHIDAFLIDQNDWSAPGTFPTITPERAGSTDWAICMDPLTEQVYLGSPGMLRRYEPTTHTVTDLAPWIQNYTEVQRAGCAVDTQRQRVVFFGNQYDPGTGGLVYDIATHQLETVSFSGPGTNEATTWLEAYAYYDADFDTFLLKPKAAGLVVQVDPESFSTTIVSTTGGAAQREHPSEEHGVLTRFLRVPRLGGYAYYPPSHEDEVWFLATR